jgi:hypothetical protein
LEENNLKKNRKILSVLKKPDNNNDYLPSTISSNTNTSSIKVKGYDIRNRDKDKDEVNSHYNDYDKDKLRNKKIEIIKPLSKNISIIKKVMKENYNNNKIK